MRNFKYVAFSKRTAKQNPQMIADAYNKLIDEKKKLVSSLNKKTHILNFSLHDPIIDTILLRLEVGSRSDFSNYEDFDIKFSDKEIIQLYHMIVKKKKKELEIQRELDNILEEYRRFEERFGK